MSGSSKPTNAPGWVDATTGARILGVNRRAFLEAARRGLVTTRHLPTVRARYWQPDIENLRERSVWPT